MKGKGGGVTITVNDLSISAAPNAILFEYGACHKASQIFFVIIFIYPLQKKKVIPLYLWAPVSMKKYVRNTLLGIEILLVINHCRRIRNGKRVTQRKSFIRSDKLRKHGTYARKNNA